MASSLFAGLHKSVVKHSPEPLQDKQLLPSTCLLQFGGRTLPLSLVPLLCSQCSPAGLGCPSFGHYPRKFGTSITKYLITNNTKKLLSTITTYTLQHLQTIRTLQNSDYISAFATLANL
jgi:hypothetical protein